MPTEDLASLLFGGGLPAADGLRSYLLDDLGAEAEWTIRTDDTTTVPWIVRWISGPCATAFALRPSGPDTPGLGVLEVTTPLAAVADLDEARAAVDLLNRHTTLNRWYIAGDPGPEGWTAAGADLVGDDGTQAVMASLVHATAALTPHVVCMASFVVGDPVVDLPRAAVALVVREQIAKVTASMSAGLADAWGEALVAAMPDGRTRAASDDWHAVVYHYDRHVEPHRLADASAMMHAFADVFNEHVAEQTRLGGPFWVGSADGGGITCEVPYGPGPYAGGAVWAANPSRTERDASTDTSLVQASVVSNPHVGNGLLLTLRPPRAAPPEHRSPRWTAALLNEQSTLVAPGASPGMAHGVGAWFAQDGHPVYACFIPAGWLATLDSRADGGAAAGPGGAGRDMVRVVVHVLVANLAKLSWAARRVLEFEPAAVAVAAAGGTLPLTGFAAGRHARGPAFGEPAAGTDPGARILASAFRHTVGDDRGWARSIPERRGFVWSPNAFRQIFERTPCACQEPGTMLSIATILGRARPGALNQLAEEGAAGHPFAVCLRPDGTVELRSALHVHDADVDRLWPWPTAIAVAQALSAERLAGVLDPDASAGGAPEREDRDAILGLFELPTFTSPPVELGSPAALALAPLHGAHAALAARWDGDAAVVTWAVDGSLTDEAAATGRLATTRIERRAAAPYGPTLTMTTELVATTDDDPAVWTLRTNDELLAGCNATVLGGVGIDHEGPVLTTCVPLGLERDRAADRSGAFSGALLGHHRAAVSDAMSRDPALRAEHRGDATLTAGIASVAEFYRAAFGQTAAPEVHVSGEPPTIRIVAPDATIEIVIGPGSDPPHALAGLRLVHGALLGADPAEHGSSGTSLRPHELWESVGLLVEEGVLRFADDGTLEVATASSSSPPMTISTASGTDGLTVECRLDDADLPDVPQPDGVGVTRLGAWSRADGAVLHRVRVPGLVLAVDHPGIRVAVATAVLRAAAREVARVAERLRAG